MSHSSAESNSRWLKRREFLRTLNLSVAGSVLLHPLLKKLHAEVEGREQPARFLFVLEGNGCPPNQIHPSNLNLQPWAIARKRWRKSSGRKICQEL